jgi:tricorn protease
VKKISFVTLFLSAIAAIGNNAFSQIDAGLFRFPDVSQSQIVFTYANDLWVVPKEGGNASRLSSPAGVESFPRFSPDGQWIAFSGNYDGNTDVYKIPVTGGVPLRITQHGMNDRVVDWHPDGKRILFASPRESEKDRFNQLYLISSSGGNPQKLLFPYGEFASYSADANQIAIVFRSEAFRTWKRYRGGDAADIYLFNFLDNTSENISTSIGAGEEFPMWYGNHLYFLSDNGTENRMNLWQYDLTSKKRKQITTFSDYDVHFPSLGTAEIVFEAGGNLYLYNLASGQMKTVKINIVSDYIALKPSLQPADKTIQHSSFSYDGNRVLLEARGDIFSLPAENGYVKNITQTSGVAERYPAWSPDGKSMAYWSDQSGEYELWIKDLQANSPAKKITNYGPGYRYNIYWSPDSKKIAFIDKSTKIKFIEVANGATTEIDKGTSFDHGSLEEFSMNWSPDSRYLTYDRKILNDQHAVFIFDTSTKKLSQVTSGFYHTFNPVFDTEGKYLYVCSNQFFRPTYSSIDNTFIYANATQLASISLKKTTLPLTAPRNEKVEPKHEEATSDKKDDKSKKDKDEKKPATAVEIDFDGIENRLVYLPIKPGNFYAISSASGKILYIKDPNTGADAEIKSQLKYYDIEKREEKLILEDVNGYSLSSDGKKILARRGSTWCVVKTEENQKFDKMLRTAEMETLVDPMQEWKQIFTDAWRFQRDYFYDEKMHGTDWNAVRTRYTKMLEGARSREEVNFVLGEMIGELNASHTYRNGGNEERPAIKNVGYLGINWTADGEYYKVGKIIRGAAWDAEARSPLDMPGIDIKEGNYILAVNGIPLSTRFEPAYFFQGLGDKTVELTYNTTPSIHNAKTAIVQTVSDEYRLRHLAWIESNRKRVEEATNGEAGYIYVPNTGLNGQSELMRQFRAQVNKKALIIDERFNSGGQIPDRFIEILDRELLALWAVRDGDHWQSPAVAHVGPKVMLINGWSGSGGDAFPDYFRKKKLGPLIGARTWGGLIGISGSPQLVDGGSVTVPTFRMYNPDGTWFREGYGVEPDIEVLEDLSAFAKGEDAQLERGISEIQRTLKEFAYGKPAKPLAEAR